MTENGYGDLKADSSWKAGQGATSLMKAGGGRQSSGTTHGQMTRREGEQQQVSRLNSSAIGATGGACLGLYVKTAANQVPEHD